MKKLAFAFITLMASVFHAEAQERKLLTAGTDVPVVATEGINADVLKEGQMIEMVTADDVKLESGEIAIPKGSQVSVRVRTGLHQRVLANQKRRLIIDIKDVKLPNGKKVALTNGVASFTVRKETGDLDAVPLKYVSKKYLIPTDYVMHAKVDVSMDISK